MLQLDLYKNKRQGDKNFAKIYARAKNAKPIGLTELAEHIAQHGTVYTEDVVIGVMRKMVNCVRELACMGQPVKLDGLCIVSAQVTSTPADDVESFDLDSNISNVRLQFRATGKSAQRAISNEATLGYTSLAQRVKTGEIVLSNRKGEYVDNGD